MIWAQLDLGSALQADARLGAVVHRHPGLPFEAGRNLGRDDHAVTLVVTVEELRGQRVTAAVAGATIRIQDDLHGGGVYPVSYTHLDVYKRQVQLHGGIGVTWDHDIHLYTRRVVEDRSLFGTPEEHRERIALVMGLEDSDGR